MEERKGQWFYFRKDYLQKINAPVGSLCPVLVLGRKLNTYFSKKKKERKKETRVFCYFVRVSGLVRTFL